ncbi:MAG: choice-of-anchor A family protein [Capsulimonadales bacterium]|nr:choice-of-anchor A family protein [Capsulimonadales bacterium]
MPVRPSALSFGERKTETVPVTIRRITVALAWLFWSFLSLGSAAAQTASASNLGVANDYNLFVLEDVSQSGSDTEGRMAVGGKLTLSSYDVASLMGDGAGVHLVISTGPFEMTYGRIRGSLISDGPIKLHNPTALGNVSGNGSVAFDQYGTVSGNVTYGTTFSNHPGSRTTISGTVTRRTVSLPFSFAAVRADLHSLTDRLRSAPATGTVQVRYGGITCVGNRAGLNVFNVNGTDLANCNSLTINVPSNATAVLNVSGTNNRMRNFGFTLLGGADRTRILYNFPETTTLTFSGIGIQGSVLAPRAALTFSNGVLNGTLICKSLTGPGQMNLATFTGDLTTGSSVTLAGLSVLPSSVIGGQQTAVGTVTLSAPAPSGGASVSLSSTNTAAQVPTASGSGLSGSVLVAAGQTSATFPIVTSAVTVTTPVTISASYGGVGKSAPLTVNPPPLPTVLSLVVSPSSVEGGASATGTVTLSATAPTGGATVALTVNSTKVTVPASVTVPAGQTRATFTVSTSPVSNTTTALLTGSYNATSASAPLTITPPTLAALSIAPESVKGGKTATGTVTLSSAAPPGGSIVLLSSGSAKAKVPASVTLAAGATSGTFPITTEGVATDTPVTVTGTMNGVSKAASLTIEAPDLVSLTVIPSSVKGGVQNAGGVLTLDTEAPTGGLDIRLTSDRPEAQTPGSVRVPAGRKTADFTVTTGTVTDPVTATLTGTLNGVDTAATLEIEPVPISLTLTVAPTPQIGGRSSVGTVTLSRAAPAGGTVVALSSADSGIATVPTSVTVPEREKTVTFPVTTKPVAVVRQVELTGTVGANSDSAVLEVTPPRLVSLTVDPSVLKEGSQATGTVTLSGPAPEGGITVSLDRSLPALSLPDTVTVPTGSTEATFKLTAGNVTGDTVVTVSATLGPDTETATVTIPYGEVDLLTFEVTPSAVFGETDATGVVTLTKPAPVGGVTVALASDNPAIAPVPARITVPAGSASASFTITTGRVTAVTVVTLSATLGATTRTASLTVSPYPCEGYLQYGDADVLGTGTYIRDPKTGTNLISLLPGQITVSSLLPLRHLFPFSPAANDFPGTDRIYVGNTQTNVHDGYSSSLRTKGPQILTLDYSSLVPPHQTITRLTLGIGADDFQFPPFRQPFIASINGISQPILTDFLNLLDQTGPVVQFFTIGIDPAILTPDHKLTLSIDQLGDGGDGWAIDFLTVGVRTQCGQAEVGVHLTIAPALVVGGAQTATGTVTLREVAPPGGAVVQLVTTSPLLTVPPAVLVPAGERSARFTIETLPVRQATPATVIASYNGESPATLLVDAPPIVPVQLIVQPASVQGGQQNATGTIILTRPALAQTVVTVNLTSGNPEVASVPAEVIVGSGSNQASFPITTRSVTAATTVPIRATMYNGTVEAELAVLPVGAVGIVGLTIAPESVRGGASAVGTITLTGPAGVGGQRVSVSTGNPFLTVPAVVTVPAGSTTVAFPIKTTAVATTVSGEVRARLLDSPNTAMVTAILTVLPPELLGLTVSPTTVAGGQSAVGTVTLSSAAPSSGVVITLKSSRGDVAPVPATVTVPGNATSGTFGINTRTTPANVTATLKATLEDSERTASLTVTTAGVMPPGVAITAPTDGAAIRTALPATITVEATGAPSTGGTIDRVELYSGDTLLGIMAPGEVPGTFTLAWRNVTAGDYTLSARLTDSNGLFAVSAPVRVAVSESRNVTPTPVISPEGGAYSGSVTVTITDADPNATILYTTDGSDPLTRGTVYTTAFTIVDSLTVRAVAVDPGAGFLPSAVASESYLIDNGIPGNPDGGLSVVMDAPTDGQTVTEPGDIIATVTAPTSGALYQIAARLADRTGTNGGWTVLGSGTVGGGTTSVRAPFDPTLLLNGLYEVRAVAIGRDQRRAEDRSSFVVEGNMKIGNFKLAFNDLTIPVRGIPITISRSYDSLDKRVGDFGVGWTLQMTNIRLQKSCPIANHWEQSGTDFLFGSKFYTLEQTRNHYITITFPSGEVYRFAAAYYPYQQGILPITAARLDWVPVGRTRGTLTPVGDDPSGTNVLVAPADGGNFDYGLPPRPVFLVGYEELEYEPTLFDLRTLDGTVFRIDEIKGLVRVTDPNGNSLSFSKDGILSSTGMSVSFTRDGQGRITGITDPNGNDLTYTPDGAGNLLSFTDRAGKVTRFAYDARHSLIRLTDANGNDPFTNTYQPNGRLSATTDNSVGGTTVFTHGLDDPELDDRTELITDAQGNRTALSYDRRGNITQTTRVLLLPGGGQRAITTSAVYGDTANPDKPTQLTDPLGRTTAHTYNTLGLIETTTDSRGIVTTTNRYDTNGRLIAVEDANGVAVLKQTFTSTGKLKTATDALGHTTTFEWNPDGTLARSIDAAGGVRSMEYDPQGRITRATNELGHSIEYRYTPNGYIDRKLTTRNRRLLAGWDGASSLGLPLLASADPLAERFARFPTENRRPQRGPAASPALPTLRHFVPSGMQEETVVEEILTKYVYDKNDRLIQTIFPDGSSSRVDYTPTGQIERMTDVLGRTTRYAYDAQGRQLRVTFPDGTEASAAYDNLGRRIFGTDQGNRRIGYVYDSLDRMTQVSLYAPGAAAPTISTTYVYNDAGQVSTVVDGNGHSTRTDFDDQGLVRRVEDPTGAYILFDFDRNGRPYRLTDAQGNTRTLTFDDAGRTTASTTADARGESSETVRYVYDELHRVKNIVSPSGRTDSYVYDAKGRVIAASNAQGETTNYAYDELDNLIFVTDPNGRTVRRDYDNVGRLIRRTLPGGQFESFTYNPDKSLASTTDFNGYVTTYAYFPQSRHLSSVTPDPRRNESPIHYTYFADGRPRTATRGNLTTTYGYDPLGRLTSVTSPAGTVSWQSDNEDNRTSLTTPAGTTTYTYDDADRLLTVTPPGGIGVTTYAYDRIGRPIGVTRPTGVTTAYGYDGAGNLTSVIHSGGPSLAYTYDPDGRRLTMTDDRGTTTYAYDLAGRLIGESGPGGQVAYGYDAAGNRLTTTEGNRTTFYHHDVNDRLLSIQGAEEPIVYRYDANGNTIDANGIALSYDFLNRMIGAGDKTFVYDAEGNRLQQSGPSGTVSYLNDGGNVVAEYVQGLQTARYDYGLGLASGWRAGEGAFHYLTDGQGSVVGLSRGGGSLSDRYVYDAFGNPRQVQGASGNPFLGIGGEQYDADTGLYFLRARYYDPRTGRFLSADPLGGNPENDYAYAMGDPVNNSDPSGMETLAESLTVSSLAPMVRGAAQTLGGIWNGVANHAADIAIGKFTGSNPEIELEGFALAAFTGAMGGIHPLLGVAAQIGSSLVVTYRGLQDALDVIHDPNASAMEKRMAALTATFQVADFTFNSFVSAFHAGQIMKLNGYGSRGADGMDALEQLSPRGLGIREEFKSTTSTSLFATGQKVRNREVYHCFTREKCFPAGTSVVARWSEEEPSDDPKSAPDRVPIERIVLSERQAQSEAEGVARRMTGRSLSEGLVWSLRSGHWWVVSRDEVTGKLVWQRVRTTSVNETSELVSVCLSDRSGRIVERIAATSEHPFFTSKGQVKAGDLGIGTEILTRAGPPLIVAKVERVTRPEGVAVYNFEVEGDAKAGEKAHSYFVGQASGVWVHNGCTGKNYTGPGMSAARRQALPTTPGIYFVRNDATGQKYIGQAGNLQDRLLDAKHENARRILDIGSDADVKITFYAVTFTGNSATDRDHALQVAEQIIMNQNGTIPQSRQANATWLNRIPALSPAKFRRFTDTLLRKTKRTYLDLTPTIGNGQDY